jgi:hypothetical protein
LRTELYGTVCQVVTTTAYGGEVSLSALAKTGGGR